MLSVSKMPLKGEIGGHVFIVMEITLLIMENYGNVFLNFCGNPGLHSHYLCLFPGMMIESMAGKAGAMHGQCYDATPFKFSEDDSAIDHFGNMLLAGKLVKSIFLSTKSA